MKKFVVLFCAVMLVFGVIGTAGAVPYTWTDIQDPDDIYFSGARHGGVQEHTFDHDINNEGFTPGEDYVQDYGLTMSFYDDLNRRGNPDRRLEVVLVDLPGWWSDDAFEIDFEDVELGMSFRGRAQLNLEGLLSVTLVRLTGDFWFDQSTLVAFGDDASGDEASVSAVPEPGTITLLGIGIVGIVGARIRSRKRKNVVGDS